MVLLQNSTNAPFGTGLLLLLVIAFLYFLPTVIAALRKKRNTGPILLVNLFFGWSVIGWIIALVWAFTYDSSQAG